MLPEIQHFSVNWMDGMKISEGHLTQLEDSIDDRIRDAYAITLTNFNYGLLPPRAGHASSLNLSVIADQAGIMHIRLQECRAIMANGMRVEICGEGLSVSRSFEASIDPAGNEIIYIVLSTNSFEREPVGQPDPAESPLRYPFAVALCKLDLLPANQVTIKQEPSNQLLLERLKVVDGKIVIDPDFIPPSSSMHSHLRLITEYKDLGALLGQIGQNSISIVQKVRAERQKTELALNIMYVAEKIAFFLSGKIASYRLTNFRLPPVYTIDIFLSFAYLLKSAFNCQIEKSREEMLKYFQQWTNLTPAQFENSLNAIIELEYNHQDIATSILEVKRFALLLDRLLLQMSKLKYIGDQPDAGIVIGEAIETKKTESRKGWSFLNE